MSGTDRRIETQEIVCPDGMPAFLARPAAPGRYPVVVLIHERYGLVPHTRDLAKKCAGDGFLVEVGGGGGFWNPLEREPERVLADVRSGYVSPEAALRDYGVVVRTEGRKVEVDVAATRELRGI